MTPEERFTKIENLLKTMTEHHAQFDEEMAAHRKQTKSDHAQHTKEIAELRELQRIMAAGFIRLQEAQQVAQEAQETWARRFQKELEAVNETIRETAEVQRTSEGKLNALIDTVDRIIRSRNA